MQMLDRAGKCDPHFLLATSSLQVNLSDPTSEADATRWSEQLMESGGARPRPVDPRR